EDLVAGLNTLLNGLGLGGLLGQVFLQFGDGVELGGQLCEVVVCLGQFANLDGGNLDGDLCFLASVLATGQLGAEDGFLACGQAGCSLVQAFQHVAGTDL